MNTRREHTNPLKSNALAAFMRTAAYETMWPSRCAICDAYGPLICSHCAGRLPFIDTWQACVRCGAPFGLTQCTECNRIVLKKLGLARLPYTWHASALLLTEETGRIVTLAKDGGEQRLARSMAELMAPLVPPPICGSACVSYIPSSAAARRRRSFDHSQLLAQHCAQLLELPVVPAFSPPRTADQRQLSRRARFENMRDAIQTLPSFHPPHTVVLIDDVFTTGASLCSASEALRQAGAEEVVCLTFARAWRN